MKLSFFIPVKKAKEGSERVSEMESQLLTLYSDVKAVPVRWLWYRISLLERSRSCKVIPAMENRP
jgi:hypothetical protein